MENKQNWKVICIRADLIEDYDVIEFLNMIPNQTQYIKALIRRDLKILQKKLEQEG